MSLAKVWAVRIELTRCPDPKSGDSPLSPRPDNRAPCAGPGRSFPPSALAARYSPVHSEPTNATRIAALRKFARTGTCQLCRGSLPSFGSTTAANRSDTKTRRPDLHTASIRLMRPLLELLQPTPHADARSRTELAGLWGPAFPRTHQQHCRRVLNPIGPA